MIRLLPIAVAMCLAIAPALSENLYPFEALSQSPDFRAHPRSILNYLLLSRIDPHFLCLNAGHLDECIWKIKGHQYPPPPDFVALIRHLENEEGRASLLFGPEREPRSNLPLWPVAK